MLVVTVEGIPETTVVDCGVNLLQDDDSYVSLQAATVDRGVYKGLVTVDEGGIDVEKPPVNSVSMQTIGVEVV